MPVENKRGGSLKLLTCRICAKQFTRRKFQPVCCHACNLIYKATQTPPHANLQGAITDDTSNTN